MFDQRGFFLKLAILDKQSFCVYGFNIYISLQASK